MKTCERCGREMDDDYRIAGEEGVGGNCGECGDTLCAACADWSKDGLCKLCQQWDLIKETAGA